MSPEIKKGALPIESVILSIRNQRVIVDVDLANLYGVSTKRLNEQVKRNIGRFPQDFMFQLTPADNANVVTNCDHIKADDLKPQISTSSSPEGNRSQNATGSQKHRDPRYRPYAFTEHGAIMAATILNSPRAVEMSLFVVRAFVKMREYLIARQITETRLAEIEKTLMGHDASLRNLYAKIRPLLLTPPDKPKRKIGFRTEEKESFTK